MSAFLCERAAYMLSEKELARLDELYEYERALYRKGAFAVAGVDEVGRGPVAGPVSVGACILTDQPMIEFLNDSKRVTEKRREKVAAELKALGVPCAVEHIAPEVIDEIGIVASLQAAMRRAISALPMAPDTVLLDGNPLNLGVHEISIVKGDAKVACISAASILAKVERDALMKQYDETYPEYGFSSHKGYASAAHIDAIKRYGLSPIHRVSFCQNFLQERLF